MATSLEKKISRDGLKQIYKDQKRRKNLLKSMPEGDNKKITEEIEKCIQSSEKNSIEFYKKILEEE